MLLTRLRGVPGCAAALVIGCFVSLSFADTLELTDGRKLENCYVRDEGTRVVVWRQLADVGQPPEALPRDAVKSYTLQRGSDWDRPPDLPDLSVTFIELDPKRYSLHGRIECDQLGRPLITGAPVFKSQGQRDYLEPNQIVEGIHLNYRPTEEVTLTAHVKNVGFTAAGPFRYKFFIDEKPVLEGRCTESVAPMQEMTFSAKWKWELGQHTARFRIEPEGAEIATTNNELTDPLWGWGLIYIVNPGRVAAWHNVRNAYGTFSWEDYHRGHIDLMNQIFAASIYPAAPEGIRARVRLDRIIYAHDVPVAEQARWKENGLADDQGARAWRDSPAELASGKWSPPEVTTRNQVDWSLLRDLGHELGLPDYEALDYAGSDDHMTPDTGERITHVMRYPAQMMYRPGPVLFGEADAGYLNYTIDKPRGYHGDLYFAVPRVLGMRVIDLGGHPVSGALVEVFQRGVEVESDKAPGGIEDLKFWSVVEDGNFEHPVSKHPVMTGKSDPSGVVRMIPRAAESVRTLNGLQRRMSGFGNLDTGGKRGLLLIRVTKDDRAAWFWVDITEANTAWFRGQQEYCEFSLHTPFGAPDSPPPPGKLQAHKTGEHGIRLSWSPSQGLHPRQYLGHVIGYTIYGRVGNDGLNDWPWLPLATFGPEATTAELDLRTIPQGFKRFSGVQRVGVAAIGECSVMSELTELVVPGASTTP